MKRVYVNVECNILNNGQELPSVIFWPDGQHRWNIEKVLHVKKQDKIGQEGFRYTIVIGSAEKYIYRNNTGWYVIPTELRR